MQSDYYKYFTNLHRKIDIGSGAAKFTKVSIYHLLCTVKFACFISLSTKGYKINKIIKLLTNINSTESYTKDMNLKILPEPRYVLNMFSKLTKSSSIISTRKNNYAFNSTRASILIQGSK